MVDNSERSIVLEDDPWIRLLLCDLLTDGATPIPIVERFGDYRILRAPPQAPADRYAR